MEPGTYEVVPYHDAKRRLVLYDCLESDYLAVQEWLDRPLRGDYLFKKNHLVSIIRRPTSRLLAVLLDGLYVGTVVFYKDSILHNIMVAEEWRRAGGGGDAVLCPSPSPIRGQTHMRGGGPGPVCPQLAVGSAWRDPRPPP